MASWINEYAANSWVKLLHSLGPSFPSATASDDEWHSFVYQCFHVPAGLAIVGVVAALAVLVMSCCCGCGRRNPTRRPSSCLPLVMAILTAAVIVCGSLLFWYNAAPAAASMGTTIDKAIGDIKSAYADGVGVQTTTASLQTDLAGLETLCVAAKPIVDPLKAQATELDATIALYIEKIQPIAGNLTSWKQGEGHEIVDIMSMLATVPFVLTLLCVVAVFFGVCCTRATDGSGKCTGCCVKSMGPLVFAPAILLVALCSAGEFGFAIASSSFCNNPDVHFLAVVDFASGSSNSTASQVSSYYVTGKGENPLANQLNTSATQLAEVEQQVTSQQPAIAKACPTWKGYDQLKSDLDTTKQDVDKGQALLTPQNIYPYYHEVVHTFLCDDVVVGLGWLVVFQAIVACVMLPCLICLSERFLTTQHRFRDERLMSAHHPFANSRGY